ncbi:aldehyde dehydrogenase family protein [Halocynthiibacter sp.]|uniref:aldehyde dehydrogenase family protein n=1 Tax=Halocynthiibacter sp. TaxID=1979210 RepID=UPI003C45AAD7
MAHNTKTMEPEFTSSIVNPATGKVMATVPIALDQDIEKAVCDAKRGRAIAKSLSRAERARVLMTVAELVQSRAEKFAKTIVMESGKTIRQARKEVARCVNTLTLSAEEAKRLAGEVIPFDSFAGNEDRDGYFLRDPLGIILAITPFNDPLNLVAHKLGPAIAAGNTVILKPSSLTPLSALALTECFHEAGLPKEVLCVVTGDGATGDVLVRHPEIAMVSFTGGSQTGEKITRAAGLKRMSMDLGGNAPVIVMPDADIADAVDACVSGAFWASGQNCIGTQRIFCHGDVFEQFLTLFKNATVNLVFGDPMDDITDVGPMASAVEAERIESWVSEAIEQGAVLVTGHKRDGAFYSPTVLTNVPENASVRCEEVFAPVVIIEAFDELSETLNKANQPDFMLHAGIFSNDLRVIQTAIETLDVGGLMINDSSDFRFDGMPFGGSKRGSIGREGVKFAVEEMTQTKVVCFRRLAE